MSFFYYEIKSFISFLDCVSKFCQSRTSVIFVQFDFTHAHMSNKRKSEEEEESLQSKKKLATCQVLHDMEKKIRDSKKELKQLKNDNSRELAQELYCESINKRAKIQSAFRWTRLMYVERPIIAGIGYLQIRLEKDGKYFTFRLVNGLYEWPGIINVEGKDDRMGRDRIFSFEDAIRPSHGSKIDMKWDEELRIFGVENDSESIKYFLYEIHHLIQYYFQFQDNCFDRQKLQAWIEALFRADGRY